MNKLEKVLAEYHKYLTRRQLANKAHAPYLVRWVREFLRFASDKTGHEFETVIEMLRFPDSSCDGKGPLCIGTKSGVLSVAFSMPALREIR